MAKKQLLLDSIPDHIVPSIVQSLGSRFEQLAIELPSYGPRRLADTLKACVRWALKLYQHFQPSDATIEPALVDAVFARLLANLHDTCTELIHPPGISEFPHELLPAAQEWLCTFTGISPQRTSIAFLPQWTYNYAISERGSSLQELFDEVTAYLPCEAALCTSFHIEAKDLPSLFYVFRFPEAEGRNILYYPIFLHEFGHAIDWNKQISEKVFGSIHLELESDGNDEDEDAIALREMVENWLSEFVADAVAVHLGGPSLVFALWHLSLVVNVLDNDTSTHPSTRTRLALMVNQLTGNGFDTNATIGEHLSSIGKQSQPSLEAGYPTDYPKLREAVLAKAVIKKIIRTVEHTFPKQCFDQAFYDAHVDKARANLQDGCPALPEVEAPSALPIIINAAWEIGLIHKLKPFHEFIAPSGTHAANAFRAMSELALKGIESWYVRNHF